VNAFTANRIRLEGEGYGGGGRGGHFSIKSRIQRAHAYSDAAPKGKKTGGNGEKGLKARKADEKKATENTPSSGRA